MRLPQKRKREKTAEAKPTAPIRCQPHLRYIRSLECALYHNPDHDCFGRIEPAHIRTETDGGTSLKPGDNWTIPLCHIAHAEQHQIGEDTFEKRYKLDMKEMAKCLWDISPAGIKYRFENK